MQIKYPNKYIVNLYYRSSRSGTSLDPELNNKEYSIKNDSEIIYSYEFKTSGVFEARDLICSELFTLGSDFYNSGEFYKIEILAG